MFRKSKNGVFKEDEEEEVKKAKLNQPDKFGQFVPSTFIFYLSVVLFFCILFFSTFSLSSMSLIFLIFKFIYFLVFVVDFVYPRHLPASHFHCTGNHIDTLLPVHQCNGQSDEMVIPWISLETLKVTQNEHLQTTMY